MKTTSMDLKIGSHVKPPLQGHPQGKGMPKTARWYLEQMKPGQHVDCTPEEANRFRPAASRLGVPITSEKVTANKVRVWKLKPPIKTVGKARTHEHYNA